MTYAPTTWIDGSTPALDAANLNKAETGIDEAHAMLGEGVGLSGSFLLNNNVALQSKDAGGTARSILSIGTDNLTRVGPQSAPNSAGDLLFYANGAEAARFVPAGNLQFVDAKNVVIGTSTGTKIGTATTQKIAFYNATPIVQPSGTTDLRTALINLGLYATGGASPLNLNGGDFQTTGKVGVGGTPTHKLDIGHSGVATKCINTQHILGNGSSLATVHRPYYFTFLMQATDLAPSTVVSTGVNSQVVFGQDGAASLGTAHGFTADYVVTGNADALNEHAAYMGALRSDIGTGMTQSTGPSGRYWFTDFNVHGSIAVQPHLLSGINMYVNNYYNGSPTNGSSGVVIVTKAGAGGGGSGAHAAAPTYPIDIGLGVVGHANDTLSASGSRQGFTTGIQVGGTGGGWYPSGNTSRIGTGVHIRDYETAGITIDNRYSGATGPAMRVADGNGPVLIGKTSASASTSLLEIDGTGVLDPMIRFGNASAYSVQFIGQGSAKLCMAASANNFFTGSASGDFGFTVGSAGKKVHLAGGSSVVAVSFEDQLVYTPRTSQSVVAGTAIIASQYIVPVTTASGTTMTAAPTIADGVNGQVIKLVNTGSNNLILSDQGTLASSNLRLTATTVTIAPRQSLELAFLSTVGDWVQTGPLVSVI